MAELIKQETSLAVFKIALSEALQLQSTPAGTAQTNEARRHSMRVVCELEVTGNAEERGLALPAGQLDVAQELQSTVLRQGQASGRPLGIARLLAQWSFAPEEIRLMGGWSRTKAAFTNVFSGQKPDLLAPFVDWLATGERALPSVMLDELKSLLATILRADDSLWIELCEPAGYLPVLPWEQMLRSVTTTPILRLSPHSMTGLSRDSNLSVVMCVTAPTKLSAPTPGQMAVLAHAIRESLPHHSQIHIFPDDLCFPACSQAPILFDRDEKGRSISLHQMSVVERDALSSSSRPWTDWILRSLGEGGADVVHCVATGTLSPDQPRLVVARDALSRANQNVAASEAAPERELRYVTVSDHSEFVRYLGAWAAVFSGPPGETDATESRLGLRLFAHQIATLRPGISAFHDFTADPTCEALSETYKFFIGTSPASASTSPSVAVYCNPPRVTPLVARDSLQTSSLIREYSKLQETVKQAIDLPGPLPAWVSTAQRLAEETISSIDINDEANLNNPRIRGIASALKFIQQAVTEQIKTNTTST